MSKKDSIKRKLTGWLITLTLLVPLAATAQKVELTGQIVDTAGDGIIGASIMQKGSSNGTVSDADGKFKLNVPPTATITVSCVGYESQTINLNGRTSLRLTLKESSQMLDEMVVVGYGMMKKSDMTGALSSVEGKELAKKATTNPAEALQGRIAGVNIMKSGGNAGAGVQIKIRGVKTFGDNTPLYIIDGFPGDINAVNPLDIKSIEVLKDGAAAAIYGSVAANGVILITTKNGEKGETKVDLNTYLSTTRIAKRLEVLNAEQYKQVHGAMYNNWNAHVTKNKETYGENWEENLLELPPYITKNTGIDTDWQDAVQRTGCAQNYMVSVRGGNDLGRFSMSYNHANETGVFKGNDNAIENARVRLNATKYIFDFEGNMSFKYTKNRQPQYSIKEMYGIAPLVPIYNDKEKYGYGLTNFDRLPNNRNIVADLDYRKAESRSYSTAASGAVTVRFTPWLNFKSSYSYRGEHLRDNYHTAPYIADIRGMQSFAESSETTSYWEEQQLENVLSFNKEFGAHRVNAVAGQSFLERRYTWNTVAVEGKSVVYKVTDGKLVTSEVPAGFLDPNFSTIGAGQGGTFSGDGSRWEYRRVSLFGRVNYAYDDRYLLQATFRSDGSSKFGSDNRWGFFPSVALGWRIDKEAFFPENTAVSNLKLRGSWGRLGNENALGYYDFLALITTVNNKSQGYNRGNGDNPWPGSIARGLENRSLKWETTDTKNIGLDFGFFNNKLSGSANYYYNRTEDLLITKVLPLSAGLTNPILNVGKMRNTGVEVELNYASSVRDFNYSVGMNFTTTSNKVLSLADEGQVLYGEGLKFNSEHFPCQTKVGSPIGGYYLYRTAGIFQSDEEARNYKNSNGKRLQPYADAGDIKFVDVNGDGVINDQDKEFMGSGIPKVEANINFNLAYKGFDLSGVIGGAFGHKLYNGNRYFFEAMNSGFNMLTSTLDAWTPENRNTSVPRAIFNDPNGNLKESDRFLENGNFIRMRQMQLGYTLPESLTRKAYLETVRFYLSADNLFTITGYSGIDPEFSRSSVLSGGIDKLIYPFTRSFTVGAQVTF